MTKSASELYEELKPIPIIPLNRNLDVDKLTEELESVPEVVDIPWQFFSFYAGSGWSSDTANGWKIRILRGLSGKSDDVDNNMKKVTDSFKIRYENNNILPEDKQHPFMDTELWDTVPYIKQVHHDLVGEDGIEALGRVRIFGLKPGGSLPWHSHVLDLKQEKDEMLVQIPLKMPKNFYYPTTPPSNVEFIDNQFQIKDESKVIESQIDVGDVYIYNNYQYHTVRNDSDEMRYTILSYIRLSKSEKFRQIVEEAIDNYDGVKMEL